MNRVAKDRLIRRTNRAGTCIVLITVGLVMIVPAILLLVSSVKLREAFMAYPFQFFPKTWQWMILYKFDGLWGNTFISDRFLPRQWGKSTQLGHKVGRQP
jgi:ABC-type glycerol-3-phosphate transport system permease component